MNSKQIDAIDEIKWRLNNVIALLDGLKGVYDTGVDEDVETAQDELLKSIEKLEEVEN